MANCLAILCGGSVQDKINAAFLLFDTNSSGTMSFDELCNLLATVFTLVEKLFEFGAESLTKDDELFKQIDFKRLPLITAEKCFKDLLVPKSSEVNYQMFVQWITGMSLYDDHELEALQRTAPPTKSAFTKKKFDDANEWCKKFMQEKEYLEVINEMREKAQITNVTLANAEMTFSKYQDAGVIDKKSFFKDMKDIILEANPDIDETARN